MTKQPKITTRTNGGMTFVYANGEYVALIQKAERGRWIVDTGTARTERTTKKAAVEHGVWLASIQLPR